MSSRPNLANEPTRSSLSRQACDHCKRRKVKCDSDTPCSSCRTSDLSCAYTTQNRKRGPARGSAPLGLGNASRLRFRDRPVSDLGSGTVLDGTFLPEVASQEATGDVGRSPYGTSVSDSITSPCNRSQVSHTSSVVVHHLVSGVSPASVLGFLANDSAGLFAQAVLDDLLASLSAAVPTERPNAIVSHCIDLFMRYVFPTTPIVHEASLRKHAETYFSDQQHRALFAGDEENDRVTRMREFSLITALCSTVSAMMGQSLLHYGQLVAALFYHASSRMLKIYEEYDVEFPDSSSLSIRALFSGAAQHITGKAGFAVHVYGQAALVALSLQLYNEEALQGASPWPGAATSTKPAMQRDPIEVQLLRRNFWHIYMSDKSATALGTRPALLHEVMFVGGLTVEPHGQPFASLLDPDNPLYSHSFEERLLVCCDLMFQLWSTGCDLIQQIKSAAVVSTTADRTSLISSLTHLYLHFVGVMEDLPDWLQLPNLITSTMGDAEVEAFQRDCFWVQRCTMTMAYHCLRVVIMQRCIESNLVDVMGIKDDPLSVAIKKAEFMQGFVQALEEIPFIYHQVKGEPSVQRIRIVGSILLEMVQNAEHEIIQPRITAYFRRLLDLLAKLNSKASEELNI